jgi:LPXTG-motif cell wall-anchored protein
MVISALRLTPKTGDQSKNQQWAVAGLIIMAVALVVGWIARRALIQADRQTNLSKLVGKK